jgi:hypothetical protein
MKPHARWTLLVLGLAVAAQGIDGEGQPRRRPVRRRPDAGAGVAAPVAQTTDAGAGFSWAPLAALLRASVGPGGVNYTLLRQRALELRTFHDSLASVGPRSTPAQFSTPAARRTFWLNAYNTTVLRGIVDGPAGLRSVQDLAPDFGFFRARRWRIDGRELTLDQIEHGELLDVFHDPRFHMALNCGARSCPPLRAGAYDSHAVDRQLDEQATRFVNGAGSVTVDAGAHRVTVVQLFEWFASDFARPVPGHAPSGATGAISFLYTFAQEPLRGQLAAACGPTGAGCQLAFNPYNWSLNSR